MAEIIQTLHGIYIDGKYTSNEAIKDMMLWAGKPVQEIEELFYNDGRLKMGYGFCPICGEEGVLRERRPDGNDNCKNGHVYPSKSALPSKDIKVITGYMDKIDFECELCKGAESNEIFPTIELLKKNRTCCEHCGIVEVEVRLKRVVCEGKED